MGFWGQNQPDWGTTVSPRVNQKKCVEIQLFGSVGVAFGCSSGVVVCLLPELPHLGTLG
jgi:hypothetical protein